MERRSILAGRALSQHAERRSLVDPFSGALLGEQLLAGADAVDAALQAAVDARPACAALPPWRRAEILHAMAAGVRARHDELVDAIVAEAGKPVRFARGEVARCVQTLTFAAEESRRPAGETIALDAVPAGEGRTGIVHRFPAGVVVGITPFNFPLNLVAHKLAPAIAAGCPWVLKPGDATPTPALVLAELAVEAGWPAEGAHVLLLSRELAPRLVTDTRPAVVSFTGSDAVGWKVKATAGRKRVLLELGGAAPVLVQPDADLDLAAERIAFGAFAYAGQVCISVQRVLVHRDAADALRDGLVHQVDHAVAWGDPRDEATVSGPLIADGAADRVQSWIDAATAQGARVLAGGGRQGPRMLRPAVLDHVPLASDLVQRELFGPAVVLDVYDDLDQGIAMANAGPWGLQAGVFTRDIGAIFACHRGLEVGGVIHDDVPTWRVDHMPYGGVKQSGFGREGLRYAIAEFTEPRLLALRV